MQGIIAGCTNYDIQSLNEILVDIKNYIEYADSTKKILEGNNEYIINNRSTVEVSDDFVFLIERSVIFLQTIIDDLKIVKSDIEGNQVSEKTYNLLKNIGKQTNVMEENYSEVYYADGSIKWKKYYNELFCKYVETSYGEGRDFFITLKDVNNIAERIRCYMDMNRNFINNNITINGNVTNSNIQVGENNVIENNIDYNKLKDKLNEIRDCVENSMEEDKPTVLRYIDKAVILTDKREKGTDIKSVLSTAKRFVESIGISVLANKIGEAISLL